MTDHKNEMLMSTILIVDDIPENLRLISLILKEHGYNIRVLRSGKRVMSSVLFSLPDLILLDIMMPEIDGYEVCRQLKSDEKTSKIPVIFISALDDMVDKVKAFSVGGVDYISKPFQAEEVLVRVQTHLSISNLQKMVTARNEKLQHEIAEHRKTSAALQEREEAYRNLLEKKLKDTEEKFRLSFMTALDAYFWTNLEEDRIIEINPAFENLFGVTRDEVIGKMFLDLDIFYDPDKPKKFLSELKSKDFVKDIELKGKRKDEQTITVLFSASKLLINNQTFILGTIKDITSHRMLEAENKKLTDQFYQVQKMEAIGTLAGGIAHDFNNILVPIICYTEIMADEIPEDSPLHSSLDEIYSAAIRAKSLVSQILTFARQEKGEVNLIQIQHIVKEALKLIRSTVPTTIEIRHDISSDCGVIKANPTQIHQIVMNLTTNAYHAMEETGGTMKISLNEVALNGEDAGSLNVGQGIYACLTVSDTGTGIPEDLKEKIFDPFFTTKEQGKGTGIGLSVVHGIVKNYGGAIRVDSEIGKGTSFNVYLPVVESYLKKDDDLQVKKAIQGGTERILFVDDEAVVGTLYKSMLERLGYKVTSYTSSIKALEIFRTSPDEFDMVITDMTMPAMSGDKLAVELVKIRPDIPVVLCTGFSTTISEAKALSMGISGFLMKPVGISDFDKKIRAVFEKQETLGSRGCRCSI